ncbi:SHOCT domain-containing protein [Tepidibacillus fermentans]|uniref:Putative membrane protein n=1 Tax=Tepidibacillus fermentans TaxID=1281767 RepID=A0A4R3K6C4_9BACI|nr:SHOCT domain-containing protein [Tepidibacillus fermentans]TCS78231.1 putative membrane protein [Tepidibacillus fermentans]
MFAGFGPGRGFGYGMGYYGGYGFLWMIGIIILVVILMFLFRRRRYFMGNCYHRNHHYNEYYSDPVQPKSPNQEALEILKARFAKGEITEEEYKKMKEIIKNE